jgi:hypothetical protein
MAPARVLTPAQVRTAGERYVAARGQLTVRELATELWVHPSTLSRYLREDGVTIYPPRAHLDKAVAARRLHSDVVLESAQLLRLMAPKEVAELLGISPTTARRRRRQYVRDYVPGPNARGPAARQARRQAAASGR